jgi:Protein of unknown function (DUF2786)
MTKEIDDKIINKVRKALALAQDNPSDEEAHAAMLAVQRLLVKHNLSMSDVEDLANEKEKNVSEDFVSDISGRIPWWKKHLSIIIAENFKCKTFLAKLGNYKGGIKFLGLEEDVLVAKSVYQYAEKILDTLATRYVQKQYREKKPTKGVRNKYISGFLDGLDHKFKEQVEKNNWGLMIITDALVEQAIEDKKLRKASNSGIQPRFSDNQEAYDTGYEQGQDFGDSQGKKGIE